MYRESWHGPVSLPTAVVCGATGKRISFFFLLQGLFLLPWSLNHTLCTVIQWCGFFQYTLFGLKFIKITRKCCNLRFFCKIAWL